MFNNAKEVIGIIKDNTINHESIVFLGAGELGLENACFDLSKNITAYEWSDSNIELLKSLGINAIKQDITELKEIKADIITFFDILEHLTKEDALKVLSICNAKQIIMFIPIQDKLRQPLETLETMQRQSKTDNKRMTQHLSLWTPEEMKELGFKVWHKDNYFGKEHNFWGAMIAIKNN